MNSTIIGRQAEAQAAAYLKQRGYRVLQQNWRTRYCEIDIVAAKDSVVYFVEVKYRSQGRHGTGIDYITSSKLRRMQFAARVWISRYAWQGDYRLVAIEVDGTNFAVTRLVEL